jgi:hypothetical protein
MIRAQRATGRNNRLRWINKWGWHTCCRRSMDRRDGHPLDAGEIFIAACAFAAALWALWVLYAVVTAPAHVPCYDDCMHDSVPDEREP